MSSIPKSPIRIGLIGLSTNATSSWAETAHLPHLLSSPHYTITALCNSSLASAQAAVKHYKLPSITKTYGSPTELAEDPDVDLVVISVAVGKHFELAKPILEKGGKDLYVEWPLGASAEQARELAQLARAKGVRTVVGAETRVSPVVVKLRELLDGGRIGRVTSSNVVASLGPQPSVWPTSTAYYLDIRSGGNPLTIGFGHFIGAFIYLLGPFETSHSILHTTYPDVKLVDAPLTAIMGNTLTPAQLDAAKPVQKTGPDEILLHGRLDSGATASLTYRSTGLKEALDETAFRWLITGTEGEIEVTQSLAQAYLQALDCKVRVLGKDGVKEDVVLDWEVEEKWTVYGKNTSGADVGRLYDAFARGDKKVCMDFEQAVEVHQLLDGMINESEQQRS